MLKRSFGLCFLLSAAPVVAQQRPAASAAAPGPASSAPPTPPAAAAATPDRPGTQPSAPSPPLGTAAVALSEPPPLPRVADDMLATVPPATNVLQGWRDAVRLLRKQSATLRSLKAQQDVAIAQARSALTPALPSMTANASVTRQLLSGEARVTDIPASLQSSTIERTAVTLPANPTTWRAWLSLRVPIVALPAWHNRATALQQIEVAQLNSKAAERVAIAQVADALVSTVTAERLAEVSRVSLESALSTLNLSKRRAALGAASTVDMLRLEQEVSLSRGQVVSANDGVLRAREALGAALGSAEPYGVTPLINLDELANDAKSNCRPADVLARSDVRAAQASVAVAKHNQAGISKTYWPTVDAISSVTYESPVSAINNEHVTWSIGGVLSWSLYDGGLRYATGEQRTAELRVASEQLGEAKRRARLEVTQAFRAVKAAEAKLVVSARTREIAAETARLTKVAYLNGSGTSFDLVDTARRQREAELDYTVQEFQVVRARIAALLALATCDV